MAGQVYEVAVVGYGPAGVTAAIYAARKKLKTILVGEEPGGEITNSGPIDNWPGGGKSDGLQLSEAMVKHLQLYKDDVEIKIDKVSRISKDRNLFKLETGAGEILSHTVIYAAGRHPRMLQVPGEEEYKNRGVTYCATCDAPLFAGKQVAVIGGGNTGAEAVIMLQKIAEKIYFLHLEPALRADPVLIRNFENDPKVEIVLEAKTLSIAGDTMVEKLVYEDIKSGEKKQLAVQGIFINIGAIPNTEPVGQLVALDDFKAIIADRYGTTNVPGFFAAGDVTDIRDAQIVVAAGHGCSAALSASDYLARR
jgi:alkyl hydroperoxide reductase subunit F